MRERTRNAGTDALSIFDGIGYYEWRLGDDHLSWSPGLLKIYGLEQAPDSEAGFTALVHPDDRTRVEAETSTFMGKGEAYAHEFRIVRPDGEIRYIHDRGVIERGPDGRAQRLLGMNIDFTDQARGRHTINAMPLKDFTARRGAEDRLPVAAAAGQFGMYELDVDTGRTHWSPALLQLLGREDEGPEADIGQAIKGLHPLDRERAQAEMEAALTKIGPYEITYRIRRPQGETIWITDRGETFGPPDPVSGRARRAVGILQDITEAKQLEERFRENEQRLELAYSVSGIAAFDVDLRGNKSRWSPELYGLLGLTGDEPASPGLFFDHVHPEDRTALKERYDEAIATGTLFEHQFRIIRADGAVRHLAGKGRVVEQEGSLPTRMIGVNYDITEQKEAEHRIWLLMQETGHRERNLLSLVQSIARHTQNGNHERFLENFSVRIRALADCQSLLLEGNPSGLELDELVKSQLAHFSDRFGTRLILEGPSMTIGLTAAQTIGMALHELGTNAAKHGALANNNGRVELHWWRYDGENGEPRFSMSWREHDGPPVVRPEASGFGTLVVDQMVRPALNASVELSYEPDGFAWRMDCPESRLLAGL